MLVISMSLNLNSILIKNAWLGSFNSIQATFQVCKLYCILIPCFNGVTNNNKNVRRLNIKVLLRPK
jgi:hypothetical protein